MPPSLLVWYQGRYEMNTILEILDNSPNFKVSSFISCRNDGWMDTWRVQLKCENAQKRYYRVIVLFRIVCVLEQSFLKKGHPKERFIMERHQIRVIRYVLAINYTQRYDNPLVWIVRWKEKKSLWPAEHFQRKPLKSHKKEACLSLDLIFFTTHKISSSVSP